MADIEALWQTLKLTEEAAQNDLWKQEFWLMDDFCGTAGCFAGHYAISQGCTPALDTPQVENSAYVRDTSDCYTPEGVRVYVRSFAQEGLLLTDDQADALFDGNRTLSELREIVQSIADDTFIDTIWSDSDY